MLKILVADDERWIRKGIVRMIDKEKHCIDQIFEAEDLIQALEIFRREQPQIILSDVCFHTENGCDLCDQIYHINPDTKIVMISAYDDFNFAKRAILFQAVDYLLKPVGKEQLNEVIAKCIERIQEEQGNEATEVLVEQQMEEGDTSTIQMIENMMASIRREYAKHYKLSEMAEQCHVSEAYFSSLFKRIAGNSPMSYIMHVRIDKAKELMIVTEYKMVKIAHLVGYDDYQYFAKMFKRVTGETPGAFKAGIIKETEHEENSSKA